jgi:hypothetical protein
VLGCLQAVSGNFEKRITRMALCPSGYGNRFRVLLASMHAHGIYPQSLLTIVSVVPSIFDSALFNFQAQLRSSLSIGNHRCMA